MLSLKSTHNMRKSRSVRKTKTRRARKKSRISRGGEKKSIQGGWTKHVDEKSGIPYYYNEMSGETSWTLPQSNDFSCDKCLKMCKKFKEQKDSTEDARKKIKVWKNNKNNAMLKAAAAWGEPTN